MAEEYTRFDSTEDVMRMDFGASRISNAKTTPQGFLRCPARLTRVGVLEYRTSTGNIIRELRPPEEVFRGDSLETLRGAPLISDKHEMVNPSNVKERQIGIVSDSVKHDETFVNSDITVQRQDAIERVNSGDLKELSPGYICNIERKSGTWNGQQYDQIQRNIRYNHVMITRPGHGRSGSEVALRGDDAYSIIEETKPTEKKPVAKEKTKMEELVIRLDGKDVSIQVPKGLGAFVKEHFEKIEQERNDAKSELLKVSGKLEAVEKQLSEDKERFDSATSPEMLDKLVAERTSVLAKAAKIAPKSDFAGQSLDEVRRTAIATKGYDRETYDSKDALLIEGIFEGISVEADKKDFPGVPVHKRMDAKEEETEKDKFDSAAAHRRLVERSQNAWKKDSKE